MADEPILTDQERSAEAIGEFVAAYESWHCDEFGQRTPQDTIMNVTTSSGDTFHLRLSDLRRVAP